MNQKNIKIVHVVEGFIGGLATYMFYVLPMLSKKGFDVTLICSLHRTERGMSDKLKVISDAGVTVKYLPMRRGITPVIDVYCLIKLWKLFEAEQYDIIHTHCSKGGLLGRLASVIAGVKIRLHSSHCFAYLRSHDSLSRWLFYWAERFLGMLTTRYIAVSSSEVTNALRSKIFPETKTCLVENGISVRQMSSNIKNSESLRDYLGIEDDMFIITSGCRLVGYKGLKLLIETARYVQSNCCFIISGEGRLESQLRKIIKRYYLQDKVLLMRPLMPINILLQASDLAILCSEIEAQPYFLLESMISRCPIIASDVPGNQELLGDNRGLLVLPEAKAIAKAIDALYSDKLLQENFSRSAYRYVTQNHSLQKQIERLSCIYTNEVSPSNSAHIAANVRRAPKKKAI